MARRKNFVDNASLSLDIKFEDTQLYQNLNPRFTIKKTSILSCEQIANMFKFDKELVLSKFNQLDMLPIVGYFVDGEPTTHDDKAVPYGAILPNTAQFEMIDGEEYLVVYSCLWSGKYPEVKDVSKFNQSMEIVKVSGIYNKEQKFYDVSDFTFDCLTMLNQSVNPAFKKARMDVDVNFSNEFDIFKTEFVELLQNIKNKNMEEMQQEKRDFKTIETVENIENGSEQMEQETKDIFAIIDINTLWSKTYRFISEKFPHPKWDGDSFYRINGIYENTENDEKFALLCLDYDSEDLYKLKFIVKDDGEVEFENELVEMKKVLIETGNIVKFEEPEDVQKFKEFIEPENFKEESKEEDNENSNKENDEEKIDDKNEENSENYEEKFSVLQSEHNELQTKFNSLVEKYSELETEIVLLRQFKADFDKEEADKKTKMELKEKEDLISKFSKKLSQDVINNVIPNVTEFSLEEIKSKLSIKLAENFLAEDDSENKDNEEKENQTFANIDNINKNFDRVDKLVEEIKNKKNKK